MDIESCHPLDDGTAHTCKARWDNCGHTCNSKYSTVPLKNIVINRDVYLQGLASYLFHQYYCLRVYRVYAEINTFLPPFSKRLFIAMIHRKV